MIGAAVFVSVAIICGVSVAVLTMPELSASSEVRPVGGAQGLVQIGGTLRDEISLGTLRGKVIVARTLPEGVVELSTAEIQVDGDFTFRDLGTSRVTLVGVSEGYGRRVVQVDVSPSSFDEIDLVLPRGTNLKGIVLDSSGEPVDGAELKITYQIALAIESRLRRESPLESPSVFVEGSWHRGVFLTGSDEAEPGEFSILDIDPERPFKISAKHSERGSIESEVLMLDPGETRAAFDLVLR